MSVSKTVLTITYAEDVTEHQKREIVHINQILNDAMGELKSLMMAEIATKRNFITGAEFEHYNADGGIIDE